MRSNGARRKTILYVSFYPWDAIQSAPQHLAQQLAEHYNVIYVCPKPFFSRNNVFAHLAKVWRLETHKGSGKVAVLNFPFLPSWRFNVIRAWNHFRWAAAVSRYLERQQVSVDILWLSSPEQLPFVKEIPARLVCYHCMDNYESFYPWLASVEPRLFRRADVTFVTAPALAEKARKYTDEVHLVPNGTEVEHFRAVLEQSYPLPPDMVNIPFPRIGYIGTIGDWMDYEIIEALSRDLDVSVVLIGPVVSKFAKRLETKKRIFFLGRKPYRELPAYLAHLSVCIIPFQENELTRAVDPIKAYEYLAAGKAVVSTPLPALAPLAGLISQASSFEFCKAVQAVLLKPESIELCKQRSAAMDAHSWQSRTDQILKVFASKGFL